LEMVLELDLEVELVALWVAGATQIPQY
jgi:hypothetical protein